MHDPPRLDLLGNCSGFESSQSLSMRALLEHPWVATRGAVLYLALISTRGPAWKCSGFESSQFLSLQVGTPLHWNTARRPGGCDSCRFALDAGLRTGLQLSVCPEAFLWMLMIFWRKRSESLLWSLSFLFSFDERNNDWRQ
jgi:hypothetical protein